MTGREDLAKATQYLIWNKRLLSIIGLWPETRSDFIFVVLAFYYTYHLVMTYVTMYLSLGHLLLFSKILTEALTYTHIGLRFFLLRKHSRSIGILIEEMRRDYREMSQRPTDEFRAFLKYDTWCKRAIKTLAIFPSFTASLYYFKPLLIRYFALRAIRLSGKNVKFPYKLPYAVYTAYKITGNQEYAMTYLSQLPLAILIGVVQSATDCLVITLACHLCGRLSALSQRIRKLNVNNDPRQYKAIVLIHQQLLRTGKLVQETLSSFMFCHLFVASVLICIVIFQILINLAPGKRLNLINIFVLLFVNVLRLYYHCWVGEYVIQESDTVAAEFYDYEWYEMPPKEQKFLILNIARSQTPLCLVAGGFGTFSISIFADIMKTAMAYLSFLRNFI